MHCCSADGDTAGPVFPALSTASPSAVPSRAARARWPGRAATLIQWALPLTTIVLIPKCPGCVAGYVLLLTGIGLSFPAATAMRWALLAICATALAYFVVRAARRAVTPARTTASPAPCRLQRSTFQAERSQGDTTSATRCLEARGESV